VPRVPPEPEDHARPQGPPPHPRLSAVFLSCVRADVISSLLGLFSSEIQFGGGTSVVEQGPHRGLELQTRIVAGEHPVLLLAVRRRLGRRRGRLNLLLA